MKMNRRKFVMSTSLATFAGLVGGVAIADVRFKSIAKADQVPVGLREKLTPNILQFFGSSKANYIDLRHSMTDANLSKNKELLSNQFLEVFHGIPGQVSNLSGGYRLITAHLPKYSNVIAMLVTNGISNDIVCASLVHFRSGQFNHAKKGDADFVKPWRRIHPTLTLIYSKRIGVNQTINNELISFTKSYFLETQKNYKKPLYPMFKVNIRHIS